MRVVNQSKERASTVNDVNLKVIVTDNASNMIFHRQSIARRPCAFAMQFIAQGCVGWQRHDEDIGSGSACSERV